MKKPSTRQFLPVLLVAGVLLLVFLAGSFFARDTSNAFGGGFAPMAQPQQTGRYQIAARDGSSAWVMDTVEGDIFLIFADGKWREVGSILDDKKRMKK